MPYIVEKKTVAREVNVSFICCTRCGFRCLEAEAQPGWLHLCELMLSSSPMATIAAQMRGEPLPEPQLRQSTAANSEQHLCPSCSPLARELLKVPVH